jgi:betaine-aldehyde dehydrogenase
MSAMRVGDPRDEATDVGALVSRSHYDKVVSYIEQGRAMAGSHLLTGGLPDPSETGAGYFVRPTLFAIDSGVDSPLAREEIFGPVLVAQPFDDYAEVISSANSLQMGLTASVWTRDLAIAMSAARDLETGYVWINASSTHIPGTSFGGVKDSGVGREEGLAELYGFTQPKNVYVRFGGVRQT